MSVWHYNNFNLHLKEGCTTINLIPQCNRTLDLPRCTRISRVINEFCYCPKDPTSMCLTKCSHITRVCTNEILCWTSLLFLYRGIQNSRAIFNRVAWWGLRNWSMEFHVLWIMMLVWGFSLLGVWSSITNLLIKIWRLRAMLMFTFAWPLWNIRCGIVMFLWWHHRSAKANVVSMCNFKPSTST
jgi:hypothetical protein